MSDPRLARPLWRGRTNVDALTIACIEHAERIGGHEFTITQGSYQSSVAASAGTHDLGGAVDLRWCGHDSCILALRKAGMAASWHRTPSQGPWPDHIHAVVYGHPHLAPSAARQVDAVLAGRNGLANNGPDDGPRLDPFPHPVWPPQGDDVPLNKDDLTAIREAVRAELDPLASRVVDIEQAVDRLEDNGTTLLGAVRKKGENSWVRDVETRKELKGLLREVLAELRDEAPQ